MSFLDGLSDDLSDVGNFISGSSDPSTMDSRGLTQADRRQGMYSGLTQLGGLLLAAGQPMYGPDRARILSQLGNVPAAIQNTEIGRQQQQMLGMKNQQAAMQMRQMAQMRSVLQSPEFQKQLAGLDPSTAALLKAAAAGGDMATVAKIYDSMQPKMSYSGVVFDPRRGIVADPYTGTRMSINGPQPGANGVPATPGNALFKFDRTPGLAPDAVDTTLLQSLPPQMQSMVSMWREGRMPVPTSSALKDPRIQQQLALTHTIDPSFDATNYVARATAARDFAPQGKTGQSIIANNTLLQHIAHGRDLAANLPTNILGDRDNPALNMAANAYANNAAANGPGAKALAAFKLQRHLIAEETARIVKGGVASEAEVKNIEDTMDPSMSPTQLQGVFDQMVEDAQNRVESQKQQYANTMRMPMSSSLLNSLGNDKADAALTYIKNNPLPGSDRAKQMKAQAATAATANNSLHMPEEAGAPMPGARKAPDGNWYLPDPKRPGKYLMVK